MKFKKGDKVKIVKANHQPEKYRRYIGKVTTVVEADGDWEYPLKLRGVPDYWTANELVKANNMKPTKVNFLLQYELDEDPIEEFETMAQVEARIKELVDEEESLQRDSIVVYEIKSKKTVSIKTETTIKYQ